MPHDKLTGNTKDITLHVHITFSLHAWYLQYHVIQAMDSKRLLMLILVS